MVSLDGRWNTDSPWHNVDIQLLKLSQVANWGAVTVEGAVNLGMNEWMNECSLMGNEECPGQLFTGIETKRLENQDKRVWDWGMRMEIWESAWSVKIFVNAQQGAPTMEEAINKQADKMTWSVDTMADAVSAGTMHTQSGHSGRAEDSVQAQLYGFHLIQADLFVYHLSWLHVQSAKYRDQC